MKREAYAPSPRHIPELNGLRVLLVFIVAWYHFWQQSWLTPSIGSYSLDFLVRAGYVPVDGTILLSGFLLFLPYARTMLLGEPIPDWKQFYQRRIMRVVPSYYFVTLGMLVFVALPWGLYASTGTMLTDLFTHLTFTHNLNRTAYLTTQLGAVSWTLAVEMQAYLLFPLVARCAIKNTLATVGWLTAGAWAFRAWCLWSFQDYSMVVNQLPNFLDLYALGIMLALLYVRLTQLWQRVRRPMVWQALATAAVILCARAFLTLLRKQAWGGLASYPALQAGQMMRRTLFGLALGGVMVALPFSVRPLRFLMGNRVMRWLAAISMNYYLVHANVAVHLKRLRIPPSVSDTPHMNGERAWQYPYLALCFGLSVLLAALITLLIERPGAKLLRKLFDRLARRSAAKAAEAAGQTNKGGFPDEA